MKMAEQIETIEEFSSPFIEERLYLNLVCLQISVRNNVLVPFYRGAVVFFAEFRMNYILEQFSSPFIEERLYLKTFRSTIIKTFIVLVPFYRGAVVFLKQLKQLKQLKRSRPLLSRSGCIYEEAKAYNKTKPFSSPFIEERLYLNQTFATYHIMMCSRPLLSRSGCI